MDIIQIISNLRDQVQKNDQPIFIVTTDDKRGFIASPVLGDANSIKITIIGSDDRKVNFDDRGKGGK